MPKKKKFVVREYESIDECLKRMEEEGFRPIRRIEQPVFKRKNRKEEPEYDRQTIIFEGIKE